MKIDILAFGAHPDDVELGCGGTLHKAVVNGKTVGIIDLTKGELGTRGDIKTRAIEASNASKVLGVSFRENLEMPDGFLTNSKENQLLIINVIRKYQPEIVFCNSFEILSDKFLSNFESLDLSSFLPPIFLVFLFSFF